MQEELRAYIKSNSERIEKLVARSEILGLSLCLAGVFMMMQKVPYHGFFFIGGLSLLAFVYTFHGNFLTDIFEITQKRLMILALRISYLALAISTLGILFRLQSWPGGSIMLLTGCAVTGFFFLLFIYLLYFGKLNGQIRLLINNLIVRMLPALLIAVFLITSAIQA